MASHVYINHFAVGTSKGNILLFGWRYNSLAQVKATYRRESLPINEIVDLRFFTGTTLLAASFKDSKRIELLRHPQLAYCSNRCPSSTACGDKRLSTSDCTGGCSPGYNYNAGSNSCSCSIGFYSIYVSSNLNTNYCIECLHTCQDCINTSCSQCRPFTSNASLQSSLQLVGGIRDCVCPLTN